MRSSGSHDARGCITASAGVAFAILLVGAVYAAHSHDVCLSKLRVLSNSEMYRAAFLDRGHGINQPFFQDIQLLDPSGKPTPSGGLVYGPEITPKQEAAVVAQYRAELKKKLGDPRFVKHYLAREFRRGFQGDAFDDGPYGPPKFLDVLWGASPNVVSLRVDVVWVRPASIHPTPIFDPATKDWRLGGAPVFITGPVDRRETAYHNIFVDVCGKRID